jgi:UDP-3-O-[3-hydroxymyristoyl] glucosamine N-acyltransferase
VASGETVGGSPAVAQRQWLKQVAALARLAGKRSA